nr:MlaE family lipid ABC transporter permease subunit [Halovulum dunhuangense]
MEIERTGDDGGAVLAFSGPLTLARVAELRARRAALPAQLAELALDLGDVSAFDTAGAWLVIETANQAEARGARARIINASPEQEALLALVRESWPAPDEEAAPTPGIIALLERLGRGVRAGLDEGVELLAFLGLVMVRLTGVLIRPWRLRGTSLVHHMQAVGFDAIPIVALMSFLIGVVLAFQGAVQLRQFGAEVFVVDLIAISILRELGILLTAIIVAGRSGSAFTAAIGSMKMREEVDAMRTLGLDPILVLVVPRVLALMLVLPILGFLSDVIGILGGAVMAWAELGVSPGMFRTRLIDSVDVWHYAVGLIKAPFFALIIGIVGCYQGMQVGGNAESLGRLTSKSVVLAIFLVIVADAMFSIFFSLVGV